MPRDKGKKNTSTAVQKLRVLHPKTNAQSKVFEAWNSDKPLFLTGAAGAGKSFVSLYLALQDLFKGITQKVYIVRSAVASRPLGYLPGDPKEKIMAYEEPYIAICNELLTPPPSFPNAYTYLTDKNMLEFLSTSFLRGTTFNDCVVIADEVQNMNYEELRTVITRSGRNCRMVFCGDIAQNDLYRNRTDVSGLLDFLQVVHRMPSPIFIEFQIEDVVRNGLVKEFLLAEQTV